MQFSSLSKITRTDECYSSKIIYFSKIIVDDDLYQFDFVMPSNQIELFFARLTLKYFSIAFVMLKYFYKDIVKNKRFGKALQS